MANVSEESEVNNSNNEGLSVYSPHTTGFPPSSSSSVSPNPFGRTKVQSNSTTTPKDTSTPLNLTNSNTTGNNSNTGGSGLSFLRPSKLEAGLGSSLFHKPPIENQQKNTLVNNEEDIKKDDKIQQKSDDVKEGSDVTNFISKEKEEEKETETKLKEDGDEALTSNSEGDGTNGNVKASSASSSSSVSVTPGFVFGKNVDERVENIGSGVTNGGGGSTLDPSKRKWEGPNVITTGEEEESNVIQATCRLFVFDVDNSSWIERGRGLLRLNDRKEGGVLHSRLIIRTKGSLRLMLNTPIFSGMTLEKPSEKCIKITGQEDDEIVKVFLIQCSPCDAETIHNALEWRVRSLPKDSAKEDEKNDKDDRVVTIQESIFDKNSPPKKQKLDE